MGEIGPQFHTQTIILSIKPISLTTAPLPQPHATPKMKTHTWNTVEGRVQPRGRKRRRRRRRPAAARRVSGVSPWRRRLGLRTLQPRRDGGSRAGREGGLGFRVLRAAIIFGSAKYFRPPPPPFVSLLPILGRREEKERSPTATGPHHRANTPWTTMGPTCLFH
jgi:hypothetical protein